MLLEMIYVVMILKFCGVKFILQWIYFSRSQIRSQSCAEYWKKNSATTEQALDTEYKLFFVGDFNVNMLAPGSNTFKTLIVFTCLQCC